MPTRAFLLFLLGVMAIAAAALLAVGTRSELNRREDPVTVDAYVDGDRTPLAAHLPAYVRRVAVGDNQPVRRGDLVVELVDDDYRAGLDQARANLAATRALVRSSGSCDRGRGRGGPPRDQAFVLAYADAYGLIALAALAAVFLVLLVREAKLFPRPIPERGSR